MIVLFYSQELVKKIFERECSIFPRQKGYSLITFKTGVFKNENLNQTLLKITMTPKITCKTYVSKDAENTKLCKQLIELLNIEPEYIFSSNHIDNLIITNMKVIYGWENINYVTTPRGKVKINVKPAPKELLDYYGLLSNSFTLGFGGTLLYSYHIPLKTGKQSIIIPYIKHSINYWLAEPLTTNPTLENYVRKYINMVKKDNFTNSFFEFDTVSNYSFIDSVSTPQKINEVWYHSEFQVYREPTSKELRIIKFDYRPGYETIKNKKTGEILTILSINYTNNEWFTYILYIDLELGKYTIIKKNGLPYDNEVITNLHKWNTQPLIKTLYDYTSIITKNSAVSIVEHLEK